MNRRTRALFPLRVKPLPLIRVVVANTPPFVKVKAVVVKVVVKIKIKISVERRAAHECVDEEELILDFFDRLIDQHAYNLIDDFTDRVD